MENLARDRRGLLRALVRRQRDMLNDLAGNGIDSYQLVRLASRNQQVTVRAESDRLRPHSGKFNQESGRGESLVHRRFECVRTKTTDVMSVCRQASRCSYECAARKGR